MKKYILPIFAGYITISFFMMSAGTASAGFFDDILDFVNPVNHIENIKEGKDPLGFPIPIISGVTPAVPDFEEAIGLPFQPIVRTEDADDIDFTEATLNGYVNPKGAIDTEAYFEYGKTEDVSDKTDKIRIPAPANIEVEIEDLEEDTTYFFRIVAKNKLFTEKGKLKSFKTKGSEPAEQALPEAPECPLFSPAPQGRIVVEFDTTRKLVSSSNEPRAVSDPEGVTIPKGDYQVTLFSTDFASDGTDARKNQTQTREQWFVRLSKGGQKIIDTGITNDLMDMVARPSLTHRVNQKLTVPNDADTAVARHAFFPDDHSPNSVIAVCAAFDPIEAEEPEDNLAVSCPDISGPFRINEQVTRRVNISGGEEPYTIEWSGSDNLSGTSTAITTSYSTSGTKTAAVTVMSADGQVLTRTCNAIVIEPAVSDGFSAVCSLDSDTALVGDEVRRMVNISGGTAPFTIEWTGTDSLSSSATTSVITYSNPGTKEATVRVVDANNRVSTDSCAVIVQAGGVGGDNDGGGSSGGGGRSSRRSDVNLVQNVQPAPLEPGFIYLTEVPETGIDSYPKFALFVLGLLFWSMVVAGYFVLKRSRKNSGLIRINDLASRERDNGGSEFSSRAGLSQPSAGADVSRRVGDLAWKEETLISSGGLEAVSRFADGNLSLAEDFLNFSLKKIRENIPEGEWVTVNKARVNELLEQFNSPVADFIRFMVNDDREAVYAVLKKLENSGRSLGEFKDKVIFELKAEMDRRTRREDASNIAGICLSAWRDDRVMEAISVLENSRGGIFYPSLISDKLSLLKACS